MAASTIVKKIIDETEESVSFYPQSKKLMILTPMKRKLNY